MKQLFHIEGGNAANVQQVLSLRLGEKYSSFAITDPEGQVVYELACCTPYGPASYVWDKNWTDEFLDKYPSLQQPFNRVTVVVETAQCILTPSAIYKQGASEMLLHTMRGTTTGTKIVSEWLQEWQLYITYAVPQETFDRVNKQFPAAGYFHDYAVTIRKINAAGKQGCLFIDFRPDEFTLVGARDSQLLVAETFSYSTPSDVVYYVLKTCRQFSLLQQEVNLGLSGLVDRESALYRELHQYFIHIGFREADWDTGKDYPAHFFTALNDIGTCAL